MTLVAIFFPCIYFLITGQLFRFLVCFVLQITIIGWIPAAIWAVANNNDRKSNRRHRELMREVNY